MELYLDLYSQPCRSVFLFAKLAGIPFEFKHVELAAGQQLGEDFGKISAVRRVPVMKDGDFILTESVAILTYLAQKLPSPVSDRWYPAELRLRARLNEYLSWQHANLRSHGSRVFMLRALFPLVAGSEAPKEKMEEAEEDLKQSLSLLEGYFLRDKPFIVGQQVSLADLVAIVEIMQPVATGLDVLRDRPQLTAWSERVKAEIGPQLFHEAHRVILNVGSLPQQLQGEQLERVKARLEKLLR